MSHFSVAVLSRHDGEDLAELLAPYDENIRTDRHIYKTKKQIIEEERARLERYRCGTYAEYLKDPDAFLMGRCDGNTEHTVWKYVSEEFPNKLKWSDELLYQDYISWYKSEDLDEDGSVYTTYNDNAKWDWYEIGGRWGGELIVKPEVRSKYGGAYVDAAYMKDIDFEAMQKEAEADLVPYEEFMENTFFKKDYLEARYPTEKAYRESMTMFSTYAVVLPDGEWCAPGDMGWFGCSSDSPEDNQEWLKRHREEFIEPYSDCLLIMVDCHI